MEDHTYLTAYYDFLHIGYEVKAVKQDESGMCISSLKDSGAQIAYVMPSHQFPAGTVMPLKRRMALLDWAEEAEIATSLRMITTASSVTAESLFRLCRDLTGAGV